MQPTAGDAALCPFAEFPYSVAAFCSMIKIAWVTYWWELFSPDLQWSSPSVIWNQEKREKGLLWFSKKMINHAQILAQTGGFIIN